MTKQEIVNKLCCKGNFHNYVEVCLHEGLEIQKLDFLPDVNVYHDFIPEDKDPINWAGNWTTLNIGKIRFQINSDGNWISGVEEFFRHYKEITKIEYSRKKSGLLSVNLDGDYITTWIVKPNMVGGKHWTIDNDFSADGHYEISFDAHSYSKPAMIDKHTNYGEEIIKERYMIEGSEVTKDVFIMESREHKLARLCGVDLKAERLKKEKEEKERKKKEEEEKLKEEKKWNNSYSYYNGGTDLPLFA